MSAPEPDLPDDNPPPPPVKTRAKPALSPDEVRHAVSEGNDAARRMASTSTSRIPPHSQEAEEHLLSCCLLDGSDVLARCELAGLTDRSFYVAANSIIFSVLMRVWRQGLPTDLAVVAEELKAENQLEAIGGYAFLMQVSARIPTTAQAGYFIDKVRELAAKRDLIRAATNLVEAGHVETHPISELLESALQDLQKLSASGGADIERIRAARLDFEKEPPHLQIRFTLGNDRVCIATPGNLVTLCAQAKAGKTAVIGAAISSTMNDDSARDFLGFRGFNNDGRAVVHVDSEQAPIDHWNVIQTAFRRAGLSKAPAWLHSYGTSGWSPNLRRTALETILRLAKIECGGIHAVFLDGIADFVLDPNDGEECFPFVDWLQALAVKFECPIFGVLHLNPGSESKSRGHLGSQLERRSETNLVLEKDPESGRTVIFSTKQRRAPILKADGPCFHWDGAEGRHVSVASVRSGREEQAAATASELALEVFGNRPSLTYSAFISGIKTACGCSDRTAERRFAEMKKHKVIQRFPPNLWAKAI